MIEKINQFSFGGGATRAVVPQCIVMPLVNKQINSLQYLELPRAAGLQ